MRALKDRLWRFPELDKAHFVITCMRLEESKWKRG